MLISSPTIQLFYELMQNAFANPMSSEILDDNIVISVHHRAGKYFSEKGFRDLMIGALLREPAQS